MVRIILKSLPILQPQEPIKLIGKFGRVIDTFFFTGETNN